MWIVRRRVDFMQWECICRKCEVQNPKQIRMTNKQQSLANRQRKRHGDRAGLANAALQNLADGVAPKRIALALAMLLSFLRCYAAEIRVFAAASLTDSMKELAGAYEKACGDKVVFNFGASSI